MPESPAPWSEPTRPSWLRESWDQIRGRKDLSIGMAALVFVTGGLCWMSASGLAWYVQVSSVVVGLLIMCGLTVGMIHDYTDRDQQDSEAWIAELTRREIEARRNP